MTRKPTGDEITEAQWNEADEHVGPDLRCEDPEEAWTVLSAVENGEDPKEALVLHRENKRRWLGLGQQERKAPGP